MLRWLLVLTLYGISMLDAQRTFGGGFDGGDVLNAGGRDDTLRGFDPNMRIPRFRNRRLGDLPRGLQLEVINALVANGVRGSRVSNGFTDNLGGANGAGIRTGGIDINTRRFAVNGAQGRGLGVDTFTATGANGGGVGGRRFTVNNRFGDTLTSTRIGRIPPGTGGQTIDLAATRTAGRMGGRPTVRATTRMTGGMPRSGILGGLGSNVDDLFLDPVSGRRVLVRPVGVANNIVNQRTNGDGGIGGMTDMSIGNTFRDLTGGRGRFPPPTFAGGPQPNLRRTQLPIFPPDTRTTLNGGFPNERVSPFPFGGLQTDISNNVAPQPIDLSSLEPFPDSAAGRPPFNFPPPGVDPRVPMIPPADPPQGFGLPPGPGITFPRQPNLDITPGNRALSRSPQVSNIRTFGSSSQVARFGSQRLTQQMPASSPARGSSTFNTVPDLRSQQQKSQNTSLDVQVDDFLSTLDALIAAEAASQAITNTQNSPTTSDFAPPSSVSGSRDSVSVFTNVPASSPSLNDFTLPTSLPDPFFRIDANRWNSKVPDSGTDNVASGRSTIPSNHTVIPSTHNVILNSGTNSGALDSTRAVQNNIIGHRTFGGNGQTSHQLGGFAGSTLVNNGAGNNDLNTLSASHNFNTDIPKQSPQEIRSGAINAVHSLINSGGASSGGFFMEGHGPEEDLGNSLTFDSVNPALFNSGLDATTVDTDIRSIALPRGTINREPISPLVRRGSRININLRPLRPAGGTAGVLDGITQSRQLNVDGNVDIDIGVPTFNRIPGIDIPDTRATIDMTSRVPATGARSETVRTTTRIEGDATGSRIDPIDNTIDVGGIGIDGSQTSTKTTTIKKIGTEGIVDVNPSGTITRTTTTTTRRLAEAGITGESAVSIEKQLQAIEQQLVAAAGVDRPVFAVIPMNEKANQADFNDFLRNMTNANQVNIIDRKSASTTSFDIRNSGTGVNNAFGGSVTVDGGGHGVTSDGVTRVSQSSSSSSSSSDSTNTRTLSTGTNVVDSSLDGSGGGGTRTITKKTTIRRISSGDPTLNEFGLDTFGRDIGTGAGDTFVSDIGTSVSGDIGTSFGTDGLQGGSFTTTRVETSGGLAGGSGVIDTSFTGTGLVDTTLPGSPTFPTDLPVMADGAMPDPMLL